MNCYDKANIPATVRQQANGILDAVKRGENIERDRITWALHVTGDLPLKRFDLPQSTMEVA